MPQSELPQVDNYRDLFLRDIPLLDVRAPVEFAEGAFPTAENHPLIDDDERQRIGVTHKEEGPEQAVALGEILVSGDLKARRIAAWRQFLIAHPGAVLYCFRGGMRSQISQRWLFDEAGITCSRVRGGYKAMRRYLLDQLTRNAPLSRPVVIGGRTGVGKTRLLAQCAAIVDLEGLAHHRGSAFGNHPQPQPSQIDFENAISIDLLKHVAADNRHFAIEDEGKHVGSRHVPSVLYDAMQHAPLVLLDASDKQRVEITLREYVDDALSEFEHFFGEDAGFDAWTAYLTDSLNKIKRRLGGERHAHVMKLLKQAITSHQRQGDTDAHRAWIAYLLREYYDGMYNYQIDSKADRIVFRGDRQAVLGYLAEQYGVAISRSPLQVPDTPGRNR